MKIKFFLFSLMCISAIVISSNEQSLPFNSVSNFFSYLTDVNQTCKNVIKGNLGKIITDAVIFHNQNNFEMTDKRCKLLTQFITQNKIIGVGGLIVTGVGALLTYQSFKNKNNQKKSECMSKMDNLKQWAKIIIPGLVTTGGLIITVGCYGQNQFYSALMPK